MLRITKRRSKPSLATVLSKEKLVQKSPSPFSRNRFLQKVKQLIPFSAINQTRQQQLDAISSDVRTVAISVEEKRTNRNLAISTGALGAALASVLYPPLRIFSLIGLTYVSLPFVQDGYNALVKKRRINVGVVDSLLALSCLAFGYYVSFSVICMCIYWSKRLVNQTEDNAYKSLTDVFGQCSSTVWMMLDGVEVEVPIEQVKTGDQVIAHTGKMIPVDGVIVSGIASIDQRVLTGEAQPVEKESGEAVFASTVVLSGKIYIEVEKAGDETTVAKISEIWEKTADFKSSMRSRGEVIADQFAPMTLGFAGLALLTVGPIASTAILNACFAFHMRVLAPIGVLNFLNLASKNGVLVKDGRILDLLNKVDTVVFDKTGTLTQEEPHVGKIIVDQVYGNNLDTQKILRYAAAAEEKQTHPIAKSIIRAAKSENLTMPTIQESEYKVGYGLTVHIEDKIVHVGSMRFMELESIRISGEMQAHQHASYQEGYSLVMVAVDHAVVGAIEIHATVRPEAKDTVHQLRQYVDSTYIISGDQETPTKKLAKELQIDHYFAETLPEDKANLIKQLQEEGKFVCYIGDGINDAIALKQANVSISLSGASSIATDTAQVILMRQDLNQLVQLFELTKKFDTTINSTLIGTIIPSVITVFGSFFLGFAPFHSMLLNQTGLGIGLFQIFKPALKEEPQQITTNQS